MEKSEDKEAVSSSSAGPNFDHFANSLAQLLKTARRELEGDREAAKASLVTASSFLQFEIEGSSRGNTTRTSALVGWQIVRVQAFIEKNLHRTIHTRDLGAVVRRSPAHFSRSFKRAFGETPHAYVMKRRLVKACYLMMTSSASLSEIALSVGFSDQAHLCSEPLGKLRTAGAANRRSLARTNFENPQICEMWFEPDRVRGEVGRR
jgi:AraC family transcriptional regulator